MKPLELKSGYFLYRKYLDRGEQGRLLEIIQSILSDSPLFTPRMPRTGKAFSVRMSNCGELGWVSDKEHGYRYQPLHPDSGTCWPPMPPLLRRLWDELCGYDAPPQVALINYYAQDAHMGMHRDLDEEDMNAPILSVSLGDTALFRMGGAVRRDRTASVKLASGDVLVMCGPARHSYHGVDRIYAGSSRLLPQGGRFNITLRRVTRVS
jgi:alkylated DNA repair protein (DNA oxidative demethylase)